MRQYETEKQTDIHRKVLEMLFCPGIHVHCCDGFCRDRCRSPGTPGGNGNLIFWMVPVLIPGVSGIHSSGCCICQIKRGATHDMARITEIILLVGASVSLLDALLSDWEKKKEKRNFSFTISFVLFVLLIIAIKIL